jgi:hypothetical protein
MLGKPGHEVAPKKQQVFQIQKHVLGQTEMRVDEKPKLSLEFDQFKF